MPEKNQRLHRHLKTHFVLTSSEPTGGHQWYHNGIPIPGATTQTFVAMESGTYKVTVRADGCPSDFSEDQLVVVTGVEETNSVDGLYPNPVNSKLTILFGDDSGGKVVMLYGLDGHLLESLQVSEKKLMIDVSEFPQGIYIAKVQTIGQPPKFVKFVKH